MSREGSRLVPDLVKGKATICVVNYKTLDLTRLCLRSIRKFTDYPYEVVVVDNDSKDASVEYLRSLKWIRLIERRPGAGEPRGSYDEGSAFDLGLADCRTEFYIAMHSDTFVQRQGWLGELMAYFDSDVTVACVGSGKIELMPRWQLILKRYADVKALGRKLFRQHRQHRSRYHNRTICCLYRTDVLRREKLSFLPDWRLELTSGQKLYLELVDRGYRTVELPAMVMARYVLHLTHATQAVNPAEFSIKKRDRHRFANIVDKSMSSRIIQGIVADDSLDR